MFTVLCFYRLENRWNDRGDVELHFSDRGLAKACAAIINLGNEFAVIWIEDKHGQKIETVKE